MILRSGINRRQVPQLKAALKKGTPVKDLSRSFEVEVKVIFAFADGWGIKLDESPESVELQKYDAMIDAEVKRRLAEALEAKAAKVPHVTSKTTIPHKPPIK